MSRSFTRAIPAFGMLILLAGTVAAAAQDEEIQQPPAPSVQATKSVELAVGQTTLVNKDLNKYERILFAPPTDAKLVSGRTWEISMDSAIRLGGMEQGERWRVIRRNLGLAPDARNDLVLWTEVVDALLAQVGTLPQDKDAADSGFGLRVAFPGRETGEAAKARVALTFDDGKNGFEKLLEERVAGAMTGIEGFVLAVDDRGLPYDGNWLSDFPGLKLRLTDGKRQEKGVLELKDQPYFCFPSLPADREFGGDYNLAMKTIEIGSPDGGMTILSMEPRYVPVRHGIRSRQDLVLKIQRIEPETRDKAKMEEIDELSSRGGIADGLAGLGAPEGVVTLFQGLVTKIPLLDVIAQAFPPNPGLHVGALRTKDDGLQIFWSVRFKFRADLPDRSPRFVSKGQVRFEVMTAEEEIGGVCPSYIKVVWSGDAEASQLLLASRPVSIFPLGFGIGVVPSLSPALYSAGLSYKLFNLIELYAGAGIRKDFPTSFVFGVTVDVLSVIGNILTPLTKGGQ